MNANWLDILHKQLSLIRKHMNESGMNMPRNFVAFRFAKETKKTKMQFTTRLCWFKFIFENENLKVREKLGPKVANLAER